MNVKQLIEQLQKEDPAAEVIIMDGMEFDSPVRDLDRCFWLDDPSTCWVVESPGDYGDKASQAVKAVALYC